METEFTDTHSFTLHTEVGDKNPKLIRPTLFPYPMLDFANYDTRMQKIRLARTGNLPNHPDAIREYLKNNRTCYLFVGDTEYPGSIITLRWFNDTVMIDRDPDKKYESLIIWAIDNAYYKYINALESYERAVKAGKIEEELTTDEVSGKPVPNLNDSLLEEFYRKLEAEAAHSKPTEIQNELY